MFVLNWVSSAFFPGPSSFLSCKGSSDFLNLWLTWYLLAKWILLKLDASHHALVVLLVLDATLVLLIARRPLSKLQWQGAKTTSLAGSVIWPIAQMSTPMAAAQDLESRVLNCSSLCSARKWSCEVVGSQQFAIGDPGLLWGNSAFFPGPSSFLSCKGSSDFLNLWLTWHLLAKWILLKLDASHHALVVLLVLDATLVLLIARRPLSKLKWHDAKRILANRARYQAHFGPDSLT